jgi:hypothetical protein
MYNAIPNETVLITHTSDIITKTQPSRYGVTPQHSFMAWCLIN